MKRTGFALSFCLVTCLLLATPAFADSITFTFDCDLSGSGCVSTTPVGTLQITDSASDANWVDVTLTLVSGDPQQFYFNYNGFPLPSGYAFDATGTTVDVDENSAQADGYTLGFFDLAVPDNGNISGNPFTTTLRLTDGSTDSNLDALDFAVLSTNSVLYAALLRTDGAGWFGATSCEGCSTSEVPEPVSMSLMGMGLAGGLAALRRRRTSARGAHQSL
jgi:MYXO-CTERM domain-containing protein